MSERPDLEYIRIALDDLITLKCERTSARRAHREVVEAANKAAQEWQVELEQRDMDLRVLAEAHRSLRNALLAALEMECGSDGKIVEVAGGAWRVAKGIVEGTLVDDGPTEIDVESDPLWVFGPGTPCVSCVHSYGRHPEPGECDVDGCPCKAYVIPAGLATVDEAVTTDGQ